MNNVVYSRHQSCVALNHAASQLTALSVLHETICCALADAAAAEDAVVKATVARETHPVQPSIGPGHYYSTINTVINNDNDNNNNNN